MSRTTPTNEANLIDALTKLSEKWEALAKGIAEEKTVALVSVLKEVRALLHDIEQLPNEKQAERGDIARAAMRIIDEVTNA